METYFILLLKMSNLSQNSSGQGIQLEEASRQNNYILFYWVEYNMIWVERYLRSLIIFLEANN